MYGFTGFHIAQELAKMIDRDKPIDDCVEETLEVVTQSERHPVRALLWQTGRVVASVGQKMMDSANHALEEPAVMPATHPENC